MKLVYSKFSEVIKWNYNNIPVISIENKKMLQDIIADLMETGLSHKKISIFDNQDNDVEDKLDIVLEPFTLSVNNSYTQSYLKNYLQVQIKNNLVEYSNLAFPIWTQLQSSLLDVPLSVTIDSEVNPRGLTNLFGISIDNDPENLLENIIDYISVMTSLNLKKVFIFYNLKEILDPKQIDLLYNHVVSEEAYVVLVESGLRSKNNFEIHYIIDDDMCEIFPEIV